MTRDFSRVSLLTLGAFLVLAALFVYILSLYDLVLLVYFLMTAYAIGSWLRFRNDSRIYYRLMLQFLGGFGLLCFLTWIVVNLGMPLPLKNLFAGVSITLLVIRWRQIKQASRHIRRYWIVHRQNNPLLLLLFVVSSIVLLVAGSVPIEAFDGLTVHLRLAARIAYMGYQDHNVLENSFFSIRDPMLHMGSVWLLVFGGSKSLHFLITFFALFGAICLIALLRKNTPYIRVASIILMAMLITMPAFSYLSANYMQDTLLLPYLFLATAYTLNSSDRKVTDNLPLLFMVLGLAIFAKQVALYYCAPLLLIILAITLREAHQRKQPTLLIKPLISLPLMGFIIAPATMSWYKTGSFLFPFQNAVFKSPYYRLVNFKDPYNEAHLGFDFDSLINIVFHTSRNGFPDLYLGYHLLVLPLAIIFLTAWRHRIGILLSFIVISTYGLSLLATFNIRYSFSVALLAMVVVVIACACLVSTVPLRKWRGVLLAFFGILMILPSLLLYYKEMHIKQSLSSRVMRAVTQPKSVIDESPLRELGSRLSGQGLKLFWATNTPFVGGLPHHVYSYNWHTSWLMDALGRDRGNITKYLDGFDYIVVSKIRKKHIEWLAQQIENHYTLIDSTPTLLLYRPKPDMQFSKIYTMDIPEAKVVPDGKVQSLTAHIPTLAPVMQIDIDAEPLNPKVTTIGRFQINFIDRQTNKFKSTQIYPYQLNGGRHRYSKVMEYNAPNDSYGIWYVNSHNKSPIRFYHAELKLLDTSFIDKKLAEFDRKWPSLGTFKYAPLCTVQNN